MKKILYLLAVCLFSWSLLNAQIPRGRLPMPRPEVIDSLDAIRSVSGLTGTVAVGVVACADSTGALSIASYDDSHLNRKLIGFGTGIAGEMRISGLVAAPTATKIGIIYWLDVNGTLRDTRPTATNVWRAELGRCTSTGYLDLKPATPIARIP